MKRTPILVSLILMGMLALVLSACNLSASPEGEEALTAEASITAPPTRTPSGTFTAPTTLPLTSLAPTVLPGQVRPTSIVSVPTAILPPVSGGQQPQPPVSNVPVSIVILAPIPGNVVAGNVQVLGSAQHPQFLQYTVEYGPDPNPNNLWYPVTGAIQTPVLYNLLGIWNTLAVQDGTYQLRLRVFLRDASSLTTVVNNIRIQNRQPTPRPSNTPSTPRPIAAFTQDRTGGDAPLRVRFTNQSSGSITQYAWNFGDNTGSNEQNPRHDYARPGLYTVTLSVTGPGGSSNVSTQIRVNSASAPNAGFSVDRDRGVSPLTVRFTDQSQGTITRHTWNFSDGTGSNERNPSHTFTTPGTYNVFLTVEGPGGSSSTRREITVQGPTNTPPPTLTATIQPQPTNTPPPTSTPEPNAPPSADFTFAPAGDRVVQFTDLSTDDDSITSWAWNFGDNTTSTEQSPLHTYAAGGSYTVSLTVTDSDGLTSTPFSATVTVAEPNVAPVASFTFDASASPAVTFTDTSTDDSAVVAWLWDFGDGTTSTEQFPTHTYTAAGDYPVTLTVTDDDGATSTSPAQTVSITLPNAAPVASFTFDASASPTVTFTDTSTDDSAVVAWLWDFGDGTTSTEQFPTHTYAAAGDYPVTLTVTDDDGATSTSAAQTVSVTLPNVAPVASFTFDASASPTVTFTDTSTDDSAVVAWLWDFGDGTTSTEQFPTHTYAAAGDYPVTLTITDDDGATNASAAQTVSIVLEAPPEQTEPTVLDTTPIMPDIGAIEGNLDGIFGAGQSLGNRAGVFSIAGDSLAADNAFLAPFANSDDYRLDDTTSYLQPTIEFFNATDLGGATSFNRDSLAVGDDWRAEDLLDPDNRDGDQCSDGESPLACELRVNQPSVVIISIGNRDISDDTNPDEFYGQLSQIVQTATNAGVIPVLMTTPVREDKPEQALAINEQIIRVAAERQVPLYNQWAELNPLENNGENGSPDPAGSITADDYNRYAVAARNSTILRILSELVSRVLAG